MSDTLMRQFSEACEAAGPLHLDVLGPDEAGSIRHVFPQPFLIVGRHLHADLVLDHSLVGRRHCYIQLIGGRAVCIDLDSKSGTLWDGEAKASGWIDRAGALRVGPYELALRGGDQGGWTASPGFGDDASPFSADYIQRHPLPEVTLEIQGEGMEARPWPMVRSLVLVGRSPICRMRLMSPRVSQVHCAVLRTPTGVWFIDLLSEGGITLDGRRTRVARLDDGRELGLGPFSIRLLPEDARTLPRIRGSILRSLPEPRARLAPMRGPADSHAALALGRELAARELGALPRAAFHDLPDSLPDPFQQVVMVMAQMVDTMHREQLDALREEVSEIRRLVDEVRALRGEIRALVRQPAALDPPAPSPSATDSQVIVAGASPVEPAPIVRRSPKEIHELASRLLADHAAEQYRSSRWNKVLGVLNKVVSKSDVG